MGRYIYDNLPPNESILMEGKVHWGILLFPGTILALLFFIHMLVTGLIRDSGAVKAFKVVNVEVFNANILAAIVGVIFLIMGCIVGIVLIARVIRILSSDMVVTNRKVIIKTGLFRTWLSECAVDKINSMAVEQSILGKLFDYGTIYIHTVSGSFSLASVTAPQEMKAAINEQVLKMEDWRINKQAERIWGSEVYAGMLQITQNSVQREEQLPEGKGQKKAEEDNMNRENHENSTI